MKSDSYGKKTGSLCQDLATKVDLFEYIHQDKIYLLNFILTETALVTLRVLSRDDFQISPSLTFDPLAKHD
jgi:hypothetical protein